jgi:hypothetical protein
MNAQLPASAGGDVYRLTLPSARIANMDSWIVEIRVLSKG